MKQERRNIPFIISTRSLVTVSHCILCWKKHACALAWPTKQLRQYMLNHTTWLISEMDSIKYIFEKHSLTGRISCWKMLLSEYDIEYCIIRLLKVVCW